MVESVLGGDGDGDGDGAMISMSCMSCMSCMSFQKIIFYVNETARQRADGLVERGFTKVFAIGTDRLVELGGIKHVLKAFALGDLLIGWLNSIGDDPRTDRLVEFGVLKHAIGNVPFVDRLVGFRANKHARKVFPTRDTPLVVLVAQELTPSH
jgi:hypothetical protein